MKRVVVFFLLIPSLVFGETVCMSWEDKTSDSYWSPVPGAAIWNGSGWDSVFTDASIASAGNWVDGYRPSHIRITTDPSMDGFTFDLLTDEPEIYQSTYGVNSGGVVPITLSGDYKIASLRVVGSMVFSITKIEFFVVDVESVLPQSGIVPKRRIPWQRRPRQGKHRPFHS
jgi:hypothetical protein